MKKYVIIPINWKKDVKGHFHIRSVLVSYKFSIRHKDLIKFYGTKFICADDYFSDPKASHKYTFKNRYYQLDSVKRNSMSHDYSEIMWKKRRYHYNRYFIYAQDISFKAKNNEEAIKIFNKRETIY